MPSRDWSSWPKNAYDSINKNAGGFLGIAGILTGAVGLVVTTPVAIVIGAVTIIGTCGYAAIAGFPKKKINANEHIGKKLSLADLQNLSETILKVGIFGTSSSGKSTFLNNAIMSSNNVPVTQDVSASIVSLQVTPPKKIALLDGDGKTFSQQFKVVSNADILLVFLDHNSSDSIEAIDLQRLDRHKEYLLQLEGFLKNDKADKIMLIHFILNKRDLWEKSAEQQRLTDWFTDLVNDWSRKNFSNRVSGSRHSNNFSNDISYLMNLIN